MTLTVDTAANQGLDIAGGKYVVICNTHGTLVNVKSRKLADCTFGVDFCDGCRKLYGA